MTNVTQHSHVLSNGVTLVGEVMPSVSSAALSFLIPVGSVSDPAGKEGAARLLVDMFFKGAGNFDAHQLSEEFESLGVQRGYMAGTEVSVFSFSMLGENLIPALRLCRTVLREPGLPVNALDSVRALALQDLKSLEDQPSSKVMTLLSKEFYPGSFGRSQLGTEAGLRSISIEDLRSYYEQEFLPSDSVISIAGKFDWNEFCKIAEECFGDWSGSKSLPKCGSLRVNDHYVHVEQDTSQLQIALAYPSVSYNHPDYYTARVGVGVLSGGMAGRLFIEVREKRGLVYRVSASHSATRGRAAVFGYAGTTPDRGQETLDVFLNELRHLGDGVEEDELDRAKADLKSLLVIQGEISSARASSLMNDWWNLRRLRTLDEIKTAVDAVSSNDIVQHLKSNPVAPITLVTLGSKKLDV